jgi:hypothetical protein
LKEAVLKAMRVGLRADTRSVEAQARAVSSEAWTPVALKLRLPGAPAQAEAFVCSRGALLAAVTLLRPAGEAEPSDALRGHPALGARGKAAASVRAA